MIVPALHLRKQKHREAEKLDRRHSWQMRAGWQQGPFPTAVSQYVGDSPTASAGSEWQPLCCFLHLPSLELNKTECL